MNYRHIYHAGNFTEVLKHSVLTLIIEYLKEKPAPFCYMDSHAGAGVYNLRSEQAEKTGEAKSGIQRFLESKQPYPVFLQSYLQALAPYQNEAGLQFYPGSPMVAYSMLRPIDQMILNESHPEINDQLKQNFYGKSQVSIHQRDAYEFLPAILPPKQSRGIVLIDPPFELSDENEKIKKVIEKCLKRWAQGIYVIWYPVTSQRNYDPQQVVSYNSLQKYLQVKLTIAPASPQNKGLLGCQLLIINPPWKLAEKLQILLPYLWKIFNINGQGTWLSKYNE